MMKPPCSNCFPFPHPLLRTSKLNFINPTFPTQRLLHCQHHAFQRRLRHALRAKRVWLWEAARWTKTETLAHAVGIHRKTWMENGDS